MTDIKLFNLDSGSAKEIQGSASPLEKSLQNVIERNLETMLGIRLLGSEYSTGPKHGGRIDTLGIDENASPVIIEYKRVHQRKRYQSGALLSGLAARSSGGVQTACHRQAGR